MTRVGIAACGIIPFTRDDQSIESVLLESVVDLFEGSDADRGSVDAVLVSTNSNSKYLAPILSETAGLGPNIAHTVENLCNSGTNAMVSGYSYIASGLADVVLVSGAERYDSPGQVLEWDRSRGGFKHPIFWASILARSYKRRFSISEEQLAMVPVKNHRHARDNPNAMSKKACTIQDVIESKRVTDDIRLLECSRPCTGSASVLLASEDAAKRLSKEPVWIAGIGQKTASAGFTKSESFSSLESTRIAADVALRMAGHAPKDIDVAEVHDAFSVCEPMALESMGLCGPGGGAGMVRDMYDTENRMINPRGGLIGSGHPLGATGIAQAVEITQQLRADAGSRQVGGARTGLVHNMSAAGTSSTVLVLER
ncbi:MAG: thiolase family protein [Nitrosopumilus sp. H13]|nr:MAG: thiolase family protein [Nitrosopumilus sp. H13]